nr:TrmH family RNA methyltransferase [Allomuricauda sp.]
MKVGKQISSIQNPLVKKVLILKEKSRERKKTGLFVVEGKREIELAQKGGYQFQTLLYSPEIVDFKIHDFLKIHPDCEIVELAKTIYEKIAHRGSTEGLLAVCETRSHTLDQILLKSENPLILVAEAPEKPGNIGALLRTADAAALDAVLVANPKSDLYNPNIIRSSVGCLFTSQVGVGSTKEIIQFLKQNGIKIRCAALTASKIYTKADFTEPTAIIVGTESMGLSSDWLENSDENLIIPMRGQIDSMNVSVSAAILIFEAGRQRGF